ncbi:hypothetical protein I862_05765 [endosymbiont of Acanthamoeba sp. UWC8]|uniref:GNAT family N-acetyltransferase n=1 Tax=endosymbiont of Acanthamoeba sp. UWC8 TaxID=86106 RepID=UPI0004D1E618|nr:GNAT family N-acetyltransferase [endosymbiont of Acanthamoeba sp. UWC8]AIF81707.1 hypothetical protein I862_05765 [endosymbiont of Acanthamoeba sp. UWC8]
MVNIKILDQDDWQSWKNLRLEALQNAPHTFGASIEEVYTLDKKDFQTLLSKNKIFGAFLNAQLIGCVGFYVLNSLKTQHRGVLWGMYVTPEHRGKNIAGSLVDAVISYVKSSVEQLNLKCVTANHSAVKLYQKHGFKICGTEPRALKVDNKYYDEYAMVLEL